MDYIYFNSKKNEPEFISLKAGSVEFECHPSANQAWQCWRSLNRQFQPERLEFEVIQLILEFEPLHVIQTSSKTRYRFFSGFPTATLSTDTRIACLPICIHKNLTTHEMERLSWSGVLKTLLFNLNSKTGLASLYGGINKYLPAGIRRELFGQKNLSIRLLASISGTSEGVLRWQAKQYLKRNDRKSSILEVITRSAP